MGSGDIDCPLADPVDNGDSVRLMGGPEVPVAMDDMIPERPEAGAVDLDEDPGLGLSFPVGPFPRGGRLAGGRLSAARRALFSSSSSVTRFSSAWDGQSMCLPAIEESVIRTSRCAARLARKALWTSLARLGGRLSLRLRPRLEDMAGTVEGDREGNGMRGVGNGEGEEEFGRARQPRTVFKTDLYKRRSRGRRREHGYLDACRQRLSILMAVQASASIKQPPRPPGCASHAHSRLRCSD